MYIYIVIVQTEKLGYINYYIKGFTEYRRNGMETGVSKTNYLPHLAFPACTHLLFLGFPP